MNENQLAKKPLPIKRGGTDAYKADQAAKNLGASAKQSFFASKPSNYGDASYFHINFAAGIDGNGRTFSDPTVATNDAIIYSMLLPSGTLKKISIETTASPGADQTSTISVILDGVVTPLAVILSNDDVSGATASDVSVSENSRVALLFNQTNDASQGSTVVRVDFEFA